MVVSVISYLRKNPLRIEFTNCVQGLKTSRYRQSLGNLKILAASQIKFGLRMSLIRKYKKERGLTGDQTGLLTISGALF